MTNALNSIPANVGDSVPIAIASWLACLAMVLVVGLMIAKVTKEIRGRPVASEVAAEAAERFVTKQDCARGHDAINATLREIFSKVGGVERGAAQALGQEVRTLRQERKEDAVILQSRLSKFEEQIGGLRMATDLQTGQLRRIDEKLDDLALKI
jgi:hypothetical protein